MTDFSTFQDVWQSVLDHGFSAANFTQFAKDRVNEAQREIAKRIDVRVWYTESTLTTTAGNNTLTLPTDYLRPDYLYDDVNNVRLDALTDGLEFEEWDTAQSQPLYWIVLGTSIRVRPIPNGAYTLKLRYWKQPTTMSANGDVPETPLAYRHLLETYALSRCYRRQLDFDAADRYMADFERDLARAASTLQFDHSDPPPAHQIPGAWA